jgi:hypothetical protein
MKWVPALVVSLLLTMSQAAESVSNTSEIPKSAEGKGTIVEGFAQWLKKTGQNVEKEIPKIGSAIGAAFRKIVGHGSNNKPDREPPREKK